MEPNRYDGLYIREAVWADLYHDSIRGKDCLEKLPLYIGHWAGNYTFFYILNRIMDQYKPQNILELGLGESSKFINTYLKNLNEGDHTIIEHDLKWLEFMEMNYNFGKDSEILHIPMVTNVGAGHEINKYGKQLLEIVEGNKYDFYVVDGPIGSKHMSRSDIIDIAKANIESNDQFIMLLDDNERAGEQETRAELIEVLRSKGVKFQVKEYVGLKTICIICTEDFKYAATF